MAACLVVRNKKRATSITRERELKTFRVQQRPVWKVNFVTRTSYAGARLVTDRQTDKQTIVRMHAERK